MSLKRDNAGYIFGAILSILFNSPAASAQKSSLPGCLYDHTCLADGLNVWRQQYTTTFCGSPDQDIVFPVLKLPDPVEEAYQVCRNRKPLESELEEPCSKVSMIYHAQRAVKVDKEEQEKQAKEKLRQEIRKCEANLVKEVSEGVSK